MQDQNEKLADLAERIRKAEEKASPPRKEGLGFGRGSGYDFAGTVLGSVIMGILLDRQFGTSPWCLLVMVFMGFVAGGVGVWRYLRRGQGGDE